MRSVSATPLRLNALLVACMSAWLASSRRASASAAAAAVLATESLVATERADTSAAFSAGASRPFSLLATYHGGGGGDKSSPTNAWVMVVRLAAMFAPASCISAAVATPSADISSTLAESCLAEASPYACIVSSTAAAVCTERGAGAAVPAAKANTAQ
eukprot:scaffold16790_cov101-Isochrysis_galbana.AAC.7